MTCLRFAILAGLIWFPLSARADYMIPLVQITCVAESRFLGIESRPVYMNAVENYPGSVQALAKHGLHFPASGEKTCLLDGLKYRVVLKDSGGGGGIHSCQPTVLSLYLDNKLLIDSVYFGRMCGTGAVATRVDVYAGQLSQQDLERHDKTAFIYYSLDGSIDPARHLFFKEDFDPRSSTIPITQSRIEREAVAPNKPLQRSGSN